jgi:hypothetical protein
MRVIERDAELGCCWGDGGCLNRYDGGRREEALVYKNCTNLNKRYPHRIGKVGARDYTSGTPVTTFKRSNRLYRIATSYNKGLDSDKDSIACETA